MSEEKIQTRHPFGKRNKSIPKAAYELFKKAIVDALRKNEMTHTELVGALEKDLRGRFSGNVSWHAMTVKLDLEAGKIIERTRSKPQRYRLR